MFLVETYIPDWIGNRVTQEDLQSRAFYRILRSIGITFASGEQTVSATLAIARVAAQLGTEISAPLLQVRRYHRDATGRPVQYVEFISSPSVYEIEMQLTDADVPT